MVQHNLVLHRSLQELRQYINQRLNPQRHPILHPDGQAMGCFSWSSNMEYLSQAWYWTSDGPMVCNHTSGFYPLGYVLPSSIKDCRLVAEKPFSTWHKSFPFIHNVVIKSSYPTVGIPLTVPCFLFGLSPSIEVQGIEHSLSNPHWYLKI